MKDKVFFMTEDPTEALCIIEKYTNNYELKTILRNMKVYLVYFHVLNGGCNISIVYSSVEQMAVYIYGKSEKILCEINKYINDNPNNYYIHTNSYLNIKKLKKLLPISYENNKIYILKSSYFTKIYNYVRLNYQILSSCQYNELNVELMNMNTIKMNYPECFLKKKYLIIQNDIFGGCMGFEYFTHGINSCLISDYTIGCKNGKLIMFIKLVMAMTNYVLSSNRELYIYSCNYFLVHLLKIMGFGIKEKDYSLIASK